MNTDRGRRGMVGMPLVVVAGAALAVLFGIFLLTTNPSPEKDAAGPIRQNSGEASGNFMSRTVAAVSQTLAQMFLSRSDHPAIEINLDTAGENAPQPSAGKSKPVVRFGISRAAQNSGSKMQKSTEEVIPLGADMRAANPPAEKNKNASSAALASNEKNIALATSAAVFGIATVKNFPDCVFFESGPLRQGSGEASAPNHGMLLNEIAWMGTKTSATDEWIELRNNSGVDLSLAGWQIKNPDESIKIIFDEKDSVSWGGFYLLERTNDNSVPNIPADKIYKGGLSNGGEWLKLFNAKCELVDEINASSSWPGGDNETKQTLERNIYDFGWHTSFAVLGTPRAQNAETKFVAAEPPASPGSQSSNLPPANSPASSTGGPGAQTTSSVPALPNTGHIVISEVMAGATNASDYEFIELFNPGSQAIDLTGWSIKKKSSTGTESPLLVASRMQGKSVAAGKYFLAANEGGYNGSVLPDSTWAKSNTLAYSSNSVAVYDANNNKIDEIFWPQIPAGESYERQPISGDQFIIEANPNPQNSGT